MFSYGSGIFNVMSWWTALTLLFKHSSHQCWFVVSVNWHEATKINANHTFFLLRSLTQCSQSFHMQLAEEDSDIHFHNR